MPYILNEDMENETKEINKCVNTDKTRNKHSTLYLCNGNVPGCKKTSCYLNSGDCLYTKNVKYAKNFKFVGGVYAEDQQNSNKNSEGE